VGPLRISFSTSAAQSHRCTNRVDVYEHAPVLAELPPSEDDMIFGHRIALKTFETATRVVHVEGNNRGPLLRFFRREAGGQRFEAIFIECLNQPRDLLIVHAFGHELAKPLYA
jgi:hypothetical protein